MWDRKKKPVSYFHHRKTLTLEEQKPLPLNSTLLEKQTKKIFLTFSKKSNVHLPQPSFFLYSPDSPLPPFPTPSPPLPSPLLTPRLSLFHPHGEPPPLTSGVALEGPALKRTPFLFCFFLLYLHGSCFPFVATVTCTHLLCRSLGRTALV